MDVEKHENDAEEKNRHVGLFNDILSTEEAKRDSGGCVIR